MVPPDLRDIHGLDPIPWWPPAPGWTLLLAVLALSVAGLLAWRWWRSYTPRDWRAEARRRLRDVRERFRYADARTLAGETSELMRRIAIVRHGRRACAGLVGEAWLKWLERTDPQGFQWQTRGRPLIDLPYAPPGRRVSAATLEPLLDAAEQWLVVPEEAEPVPSGRVARLRQALTARLRRPTRTLVSARV
jgi:hypothetical protein